MRDSLLNFYHHLPPSLRSLAGSLNGLRLRHWRYGPETERLIEEANERDSWSQERWKTWQEEKLVYVLNRAATQVPYYREQWAARRRHGDKPSWERLENWPILRKETLQENAKAFIADDCSVRRMYYDHTSGTTGTPLELWLSRAAIRGWFALFEARARRWNGVSRYDNWATLGGQLIIPRATQKPPFWIWNASMKQLYLSANHISRRNIPAYIDALNRYHITHMLAYSFSVSSLAREALDLGLSLTNLRLVISIAEPLTSWQRRALREGFNCEVRETYGMAEMVTAASECAVGTLHLWPEVGWLEVMSDGEDVPVPCGTPGRFVATGLLNVDMPLVRYQIGDRGALMTTDKICGCGRLLPALASVEGRVDNVLYTKDGRWLGRLDPVFKAQLPIREAQIIQETLDRVRIRYVPAPNFTPESRRAITERLQARMGPVEVVMEQINELPRTANGKFRAVISNLSAEEKKLLREQRSTDS